MLDHRLNERPPALDLDVNPTLVPPRWLRPRLLGRSYSTVRRRVLHEPMCLLKRMLPDQVLVFVQPVFESS